MYALFYERYPLNKELLMTGCRIAAKNPQQAKRSEDLERIAGTKVDDGCKKWQPKKHPAIVFITPLQKKSPHFGKIFAPCPRTAK